MNEKMRHERGLAASPLGRIALVIALTGGAILIGLSALVSVSVVMRSVTGSGINGDFEIVQIGAAIAAFCLFPFCASVRGNIFVDTFTSRLPPRVNAVLDATWDIVAGLITAVLAWRMVVGAKEQLESRTSMMVIDVPTWWAVGLCALLMGLLAIVSLTLGLRVLGGKS